MKLILFILTSIALKGLDFTASISSENSIGSLAIRVTDSVVASKTIRIVGESGVPDLRIKIVDSPILADVIIRAPKQGKPDISISVTDSIAVARSIRFTDSVVADLSVRIGSSVLIADKKVFVEDPLIRINEKAIIIILLFAGALER